MKFSWFSRLLNGPLTPDVKMLYRKKRFLGASGNSYSPDHYVLKTVEGDVYICRRSTEKERKEQEKQDYNSLMGFTIVDVYVGFLY